MDSIDDLLEKISIFNKTVVEEQIKHMDAEGVFPLDLMHKLYDLGLHKLTIPEEEGGFGLSYSQVGEVHNELGKGYISVENAVTVFGMVSEIFSRVKPLEIKNYYLNELLNERKIFAFALTEEENGSDFAHITTSFVTEDENIVVNGSKKWITLGAIADWFIVFGKFGSELAICMVHCDDPGVKVTPHKELMGLRANQIAQIEFSDVKVPSSRLIVAKAVVTRVLIHRALTVARLTTANGSAGLLRSCLDSAVDYSRNRKCSGKRIGDYQLIKKMLVEIFDAYKTSRLICKDAGMEFDTNFNKASIVALHAKYHASKAAVMASNHLVQITAAEGIGGKLGADRLYRDAKVLEIIEGTTQIHEVIMATDILRKNYGSC